MISDETYMNRCIQLASLAKGMVAPNPLVGCVIVVNDEIIGEGYHDKFGGPHAEVNAIKSVQNADLLKDATIYVSLEPCSHQGKTPPCVDLLVISNFKRVVIGSLDPNPLVSGRGIEKLRKNGIEVTVNIEEEKCRFLNRHFFTFHIKKRPYVFLKWAETENGKIDNGGNPDTVTWITSPPTQSIVHQWRSEHQSILVGFNTVVNDNPSLTVRAVEGNNPIRIILDPRLEINVNKKVFNSASETIILNQTIEKTEGNIRHIKLSDFTAQNILNTLYEQGIQSIMVEGGAKTLQLFIDSGLWDEACKIVGTQTFQEGTNAPKLSVKPESKTILNKEEFNYYYQ